MAQVDKMSIHNANLCHAIFFLEENKEPVILEISLLFCIYSERSILRKFQRDILVGFFLKKKKLKQSQIL